MPQSSITVITITQKTVNDMSGWNSNVEEEREKLLENVSFAVAPLTDFSSVLSLLFYRNEIIII